MCVDSRVHALSLHGYLHMLNSFFCTPSARSFVKGEWRMVTGMERVGSGQCRQDDLALCGGFKQWPWRGRAVFLHSRGGRMWCSLSR